MGVTEKPNTCRRRHERIGNAGVLFASGHRRGRGCSRIECYVGQVAAVADCPRRDFAWRECLSNVPGQKKLPAAQPSESGLFRPVCDGRARRDDLSPDTRGADGSFIGSPVKRTWSIVLAASVVVVLGGVYFTRTGHAPAGQLPLVEMNTSALSALQSEFNRTSADLRVILLLSPT